MDGRDTPRIHVAHRLLRARDWQDRVQLERVREWWRSSRRGGVCALVGIGGAGKTAIADRFLRGLPGVLPADDIAQETTLEPPGALFVFSFYDAPNADSFFADLADWLGWDDEKASYERTVRLLEKEDDVLLVLDGLEKIQDTGERSGYFGRILDGRLRDFVLRVAEGWLPGVRLLITSRFQLFDSLAQRSPLFWQVPVEQLTAEASVALLRQRGVCGADHQLAALARDQGFHALSVDLLGGYVARFLDGDPSRLTPDAGLPPVAGVDPRVAEVREQERRFARLAERYAERLDENDPAALALLQRVCLFRLGVDAGTLASIFLRKNWLDRAKNKVSGPELARLDETGLRAKLALLAEMKLLEKDENERYNVHPAVRDGFLKGLAATTSLRGHEAAREWLTTSLGGLPGIGSHPSDPRTLDLLEEIVHHTLAAGHVEEAWKVYWSRLGRYYNLGLRLGAYERGERICRAFAAGRPPEETPLPEGLSESDQARFVNEWALYLSSLGRLDGAGRCYEQASEIVLGEEDWRNASIDNQNLTNVLVLAGRLTAASAAAEEALYLADRADEADQRSKSYAHRAHARALRAEVSDALGDFRDALHWQHEYEGKPDRPLWSLPDIWYTLLLVRLGRNEDPTRLMKAANRDMWAGEHGRDECFSNLVLADLACERHDRDTASQLLDAAHEWAIARDAKEELCWASLVRARIARDADDREAARAALEDGLRIARDCGFGIYHVDLLLLRGRLALEAGDADAALADAGVALFEGVQPAAASGLPVLLAVTDPACGYAWGEGDGRQLHGEALLVQAARRLGRADFAPARWSGLPEDVRGLVDEARTELETCRRLREKIQDPKVAETTEALKRLDGGVLAAEAVFGRCTDLTGGEDMSSDLLKIYLDKLEFFKKALATTSDDERKFSLKHQIEETEAKIIELGGEVPKKSAPPNKDVAGPIDVGMIVALEEEFEELHEQLPSPTPVENEGAGSYDYLFEQSVDGAGPYRCAATFVGEMGPTDAALAAERFLNRRRPGTLVMLGIAAGIHDDVKLGDVVVAKSVGRYLDNAKIIDGDKSFEIRPGGDAFPCSHDLVQAAQHLKFAHAPIFKRWREAAGTDLAASVPDRAALQARDWLTEEPAFKKGQIASGPVVAAAKEFVDWVRSLNRNYLALEMESGAVLAAVYQRADPTRSLVLRGISDFGDKRKKKLDAIGGGGLRRYAMRNAVRLLWALLEAQALPRAE